MTRLALPTVFALATLASNAFAAEQTVTLAVQNMYCAGLPAHREGEPASGTRSETGGRLLPGKDCDRDL
jgi:hypothetical protein